MIECEVTPVANGQMARLSLDDVGMLTSAGPQDNTTLPRFTYAIYDMHLLRSLDAIPCTERHETSSPSSPNSILFF
jgi:hypothetical protein